MSWLHGIGQETFLIIFKMRIISSIWTLKILWNIHFSSNDCTLRIFSQLNVCTHSKSKTHRQCLYSVTLSSKLMTLLPARNGCGPILADLCVEWLRTMLGGPDQNSATNSSVSLTRWPVKFQPLCGDLVLLHLPILWCYVHYIALIDRMQELFTSCHRICCVFCRL